MARLDEIIRDGAEYFKRASDPKSAGPFTVDGTFVTQIGLSQYTSPAYFTSDDLKADDWIPTSPPLVTSKSEIEDAWKTVFGTIDLVSDDATAIRKYPKELAKLNQLLEILGGGTNDPSNTPDKGKSSSKGASGVPSPLRPVP